MGAHGVQGKVTALGVPVRDVEVLAVAGSTVLASAVTDRDGRYEFGALDRVGRVVARFVEPFIGVVARPAAAADIALERADIVRLVGTLEVPPGVTFDWADIKLTPRGDVPPVVTLRDPDGLREAYWIQRVVEPKDNYNTDTAGSDPFYESGGINNRTADATTMYDQPSAIDARVQAAFAAGAIRVISRAHFDTFLVTSDHVAYRVQISVVYDHASATATPSPVTTMTSAGAAATLPVVIKERFDEQWPAFNFIK